MPRRRDVLLALAGVIAFTTAQAQSTARPAVAADDAGTMRVLVVAALEATLSSQMSGTLGAIPVTLGQRVRAGAVLVQLDCRELEARSGIAAAEQKMALQNLDAKQRLQRLNAAGDVEVALAQSELDKAQGALSLANTQTGYCQVKAPFAARIARISVKPYQTVAAGTPLFDLVSDGALKIRLNAPSALLPKLRAGAPLEVTLRETGKSYPAKVTAVSARIDAVAQTVELEARFDAAPADLVAGMSGVARVR